LVIFCKLLRFQGIGKTKLTGLQSQSHVTGHGSKGTRMPKRNIPGR
jgi:hypothetical protein